MVIKNSEKLNGVPLTCHLVFRFINIGNQLENNLQLKTSSPHTEWHFLSKTIYG